MAQKKKKKKKEKKDRRYIEPYGSPWLRKVYDLSYDGFVRGPGYLAAIEKMFFVMRVNNNSSFGVAASQMGISVPGFVWRYQGISEIVICPEIYPEENALIYRHRDESCLSLENTYNVLRYDSVVLKGYDHYGDPLPERSLSNFDAAVVQHEYDHLCGRLICDEDDQIMSNLYDGEGGYGKQRKKRAVIDYR